MNSSAAVLLDPKAFKRQAATGSSSSTPRPPGAPSGTSFDPSMLLSPRSLKALKPRTSASAPVSQTPTPPQLSRNSISYPSSDGNVSDSQSEKTASTHGYETTRFGRHRNMIENMYGVEERRVHPQKRIKRHMNQNAGSSSDQRFPSSPGRGLAEYMKERSETSTPSLSEVATIDLTIDDDQNEDDVVFLGNRDLGMEEVCYGRIEGAMVYAHQVPRPVKSAFGATSSDWPSIRCQLLRTRGPDTRIDVADPLQNVFGIIDHRVAAALVPLLDSTVIKIRTQARLDVRKKKENEWPGQPCSEAYRVAINLYGPRKMADGIGRHLGQKNVWLGTPNSVEAGISTYNPHAERRLVQMASTTNRLAVQSETRTAEEINSAVTKMFDQLSSAENIPEMEPPPSIKTPLLSHQKQALWYMLDKEKPRRFGEKEEENNSLWRVHYQPNGQKCYRDIVSGVTFPEEPPQVYGGLLADMMGLGKTLSILSLVISTHLESLEWVLQKVDKRLLNNPGARNVKSTLLVCPLSAVANWVGQIEEHLEEDALSYYVFHGPTRTEDVVELSKYDLIITTYSTILSELSGKSSKRGTSPLTRMNLFRIVLDEAHAIREQSTAQSQAIFSLASLRRWSVTGTPIQNRLEDLASVTRFLKLHPYVEKSQFAAYIIAPFKSENPKAIPNLRMLVDSFTLRRVKDRINLPPRHDKVITLTFSEQEKMLHEFFRKESNVMINVIAGESKEKMRGKMYHLVLKAMMVLRQISAHGKELLDQQDRDRFKGLSATDAIDLEQQVDEESLSAMEKKAYEMLTLMKESAADVCARCGNTITLQFPEDRPSDKDPLMAAMLPCYDIICADCFPPIQQVFDENAGKQSQLSCTFCKGLIPVTYTAITCRGYEKFQESQLSRREAPKQAKKFGQYEGPHTKTKALISHLLDTIEESKKAPDEAPIKSIVFSSWTSHLDLIEIAMEDNGITTFTRLDGTMTLKQRNAAIDAFREDDNVTILLATLGAGGVGLNLTAGSRVYIMEPQYNPAAIAQAVDRVHRLGQTREVTTIQFIMKDSIEEKIAELARKKQQMADMSLNRGKLDRRELQQERMKEYRNLFT
ncbi:transcription termination factor 2 [Histoplasma ohiense]|nr:transcription termination factor 2 [Histoplasma ohiense (nom. inval.)]